MALIPAIAVGLMAAALVAVIMFPRIVLPRCDGEVLYDDAANEHFDIPDLPQFTFGSTPIAAPAERPRHTVRRSNETTPPSEPPTEHTTATTNDTEPAATHDASSSADDDVQAAPKRRIAVPNFFGFLFGRKKPSYDIDEPALIESRRESVRPLGLDDEVPLRSIPMRSRVQRIVQTDAAERDEAKQTEPAAPIEEVRERVESVARTLRDIEAEPARQSVDAPSVKPPTPSEQLGAYFSRRQRGASSTATSAPKPPIMQPEPPVEAVTQKAEIAPEPVPAPTVEGAADTATPDAAPAAQSNVIPLRPDRAFEWTKQVGVETPLDLNRRRRLMKVQSAMKNERSRAILQQIIDEDPELSAEAQVLLNGHIATG